MADAGGEPRSAFEEVLSAHLDALYAAALRLAAGDEADAEDLLQQTALRAFTGFRDLRRTEAARGWLFTILVRTHLNRERDRGRRGEVLAADMTDADFESALASWRAPATPADELERHLNAERLARALDRLPAPWRQVVWMVDAEGFRQREVAEMLGVPAGTVASRLYRARRRLREALDQEGWRESWRSHG